MDQELRDATSSQPSGNRAQGSLPVSEHAIQIGDNTLAYGETVFSLLVQSVKDYAIFVLDPNGYVRTWNEGAQRIKGYSADEIIGRHFSTFYTDDAIAIQHPRKELELAKANGKYEEDGWRVRKDGSLFWANVLITALYKEDELIGFAKVTRDLTERKNAERAREAAYQQVIAANAELELLAYTISHELQEPVAAITSYTKLLTSRYADRLGSDADEFLAKISSGAKMTARLVDDLWTYSRITRPGSNAEVPMDKVLRTALDELADLIRSRKADVVHSPYEDFPTVTGNRDQILYVFKELITNAIKHNPNCSPRVEISVTKEHNGWSFNFKDNGPGIDRFFAQHAFALYKRFNRKPDDSGTGMGLPICKKIIEQQHNGAIGFESLEGAGSKFFIWVPSKRPISANL